MIHFKEYEIQCIVSIIIVKGKKKGKAIPVPGHGGP
jgi:hypothetical protein